MQLLRSAKWQERVEAMGSVLEAVQALGDPGPRCYELVQCVAFLPGWADKNFQVRGGVGKPVGQCRVASLRCRACLLRWLAVQAAAPRHAMLPPPPHLLRVQGVCGPV